MCSSKVGYMYCGLSRSLSQLHLLTYSCCDTHFDSVADYLSSITERLAELGLTTGTLLVAALVLIVMYNWPVWDRHLYPPGPLPLPFFGHTLWLARQRYSWKSIHGKGIHAYMNVSNSLLGH